MNDEVLIWEAYVDNNYLLESMDKIEYYPYDKNFSFFDIYDRASAKDILTKKVGAFFNNKQGDTISVMVSFTDDDYPVMVINFVNKVGDSYTHPDTFKFTNSGDAINVIATVLRIGIDAYSNFREVMMANHPKLWSKYITVHGGVVGIFKGLETDQEKKTMESEDESTGGQQQKRARVYKIVFDKLIKSLTNEFKIPEMYIETKNEFMSYIKTTEKTNTAWGAIQKIPVVGKFF
jgi:hypothetical protein